jgi:hypothetical protein
LIATARHRGYQSRIPSRENEFAAWPKNVKRINVHTSPNVVQDEKRCA